MENRITKLFNKKQGNLLSVFYTAGFPLLSSTVEIARALEESGADIIEIGIIATQFGRTSLTMRCEVRNMLTRQPILHIDKLVFVNLDAAGNPKPHGKTAISYVRDRLNIKEITLEKGEAEKDG